MTLAGRVALVTGAAGAGMGRSIALTLARDGADIILNYRRPREDWGADVRAAIEAMGRRALALQADVGDPGAVTQMFGEATQRFGRVDIVVNSAGGAWRPQDVTEIEPEHLRGVLAAEIESVYYLLRATLPGMRARGWGRIVSVGGYLTDDWRFGPPDAPLDYPLGKAARHWLTRTLAPFELPRGITINAVAPGPTRRVSLEEAIAAARDGRVEAGENTPQTVAEVVAFLCGDAAARVSGAVIPIPGSRPV